MTLVDRASQKRTVCDAWETDWLLFFCFVFLCVCFCVCVFFFLLFFVCLLFFHQGFVIFPLTSQIAYMCVCLCVCVHACAHVHLFAKDDVCYMCCML
jgi:hypothetical protein